MEVGPDLNPDPIFGNVHLHLLALGRHSFFSPVPHLSVIAQVKQASLLSCGHV